MNENIKLLLKKLSEDETLKEKFKDVKDPDKAYEIATSIQGGYTKEEFFATMKEIHENMSKDLSDDDLEKAAGGVSVTDITSIISTGAAVLSAAMAAL